MYLAPFYFIQLFEMGRKLLDLSQLAQSCLKCMKHLTSYKDIQHERFL